MCRRGGNKTVEMECGEGLQPNESVTVKEVKGVISGRECIQLGVRRVERLNTGV